jgi:hypothetical protein
LILRDIPTARHLPSFAFAAKPVAKLSQNSVPLSSLSQNPGLLEHLRVALPQQLSDPFVGDAARAQAVDRVP